jgi:hypothetical protein
MKSLTTQDIFTKGLLLAAVFSVAATGVIASSAILGQQYPSLAFAQEELGITDTTTATDNATGTTAMILLMQPQQVAATNLQVLLLVWRLHQTA